MFNQVINQWEITASEVPKKCSKPRTNALNFCEFFNFIYMFTLSHNYYIQYKNISDIINNLCNVYICFVDGREKFVRDALNSMSGTSDATNKDKVVPIHFYMVDVCGTSSTAEHSAHSSTVAVVHKGKKRRPSEEEQSSAPLTKRQSLSDLSAEDLDLLNSY